MAELFVVATPIGNLSDITLRAIETLKNVDVIACEDTRITKILCEKYDISTRLISYHKYSENARLDLFLGYLKEGKNIALVSDAGTPTISDPGAILVAAAAGAGYKVTPIVGASAVTALLAAVPRESEEFKFIGFLPRQKTKIQEIAVSCNVNTVFYESPKRLLSTLEAILEVSSDIKIAIGRELTKKFEEIIIGTPQELLKHYESATLKGEIVGMVYAAPIQTNNADTIEKIRKLQKLNLPDKQITAILHELYGLNKNETYALICDSIKKCLK